MRKMAHCRVRFLILIRITRAEPPETTKAAIVRATFSGTAGLAEVCSVEDTLVLGVAVSVGCG
jgi:hypothetical protein